MRHLLVVDDAPGVVKGLKLSLEQEGYLVSTATNGREALAKINAGTFDAILLDLMLPEVDGLTVCREVRKWSAVPIIMLTAKSDDLDKILGLEIGADDYVTKPFNTKEVVARIRALFRRIEALQHPGPSERIAVGDLVIHVPQRRAELADHTLDLTSREFDLLLTMASHPGVVYTRQQLLDLVWGYEYEGDERTVDVHMRRLREKLEPEPGNPRYLKTMRGAGYFVEARP